MAVTKPRNRLVNFRVSEDEFQVLREACESGGARSLSDFARVAVLGGRADQKETEEILRLRLALIEEKMGEVDQKLFQIAKLLNDPGARQMSMAAMHMS
jgi:uncharacterized protein (DUF1778 family)